MDKKTCRPRARSRSPLVRPGRIRTLSIPRPLPSHSPHSLTGSPLPADRRRNPANPRAGLAEVRSCAYQNRCRHFPICPRSRPAHRHSIPLSLALPKRLVFPWEKPQTFRGDCQAEQPPVPWAQPDESPAQSTVRPRCHRLLRSAEAQQVAPHRSPGVLRAAPLACAAPPVSVAELALPHRSARY